MEIEIVDFRQIERNTLKGFVTARLPAVGLEIRDLALHEKNGSRWLQLPARPFDKTDGGRGWNYIISFYQKPTYNQFQEMALKALDAYQCETGGNNSHGRKWDK